MANDTDSQTPSPALLTRREAVWRVSAMLGGVALVGGTSLLAACERGDRPAAAADGAYKPVGKFTAAQVAMLDEIADTILPTTARSPGAKAAATGAFMALMVTDSYRAPEQQVFTDGLAKVDAATQQAHRVGFMQATPAQRTAVLTALDREAKTYMDARERAKTLAAARGQQVERGPQAPPEGTQVIADKQAASDSADKNLPDQRQENAGTGEIASGIVAADAPAHYFRMMKELAMLGFFTSEIGYTKAMRYVESPGRYEPCTPYAPGDRAWAPHA